VRWLQERGLDAQAVQTRFEGEREELVASTDDDATASTAPPPPTPAVPL
jgi:hypothetical protein